MDDLVDALSKRAGGGDAAGAKPRKVRRRVRTGRRRRRGDLSVVIMSHRHRARTRRKQQRIQSKIGEMGMAQLKEFLVQKGLIKPSSKAPEDVLRHIARGIFVN